MQYLADTPNGAWAELIRHEEIRDPEDLAGIRRAIWAVEIPKPPTARPQLADGVLRGGPESYSACRREAQRLRQAGADGLRAPSAALLPGGATGFSVHEEQIVDGPPRDGEVFALFGARPELVGWPIDLEASPPVELLDRIRHFDS